MSGNKPLNPEDRNPILAFNSLTFFVNEEVAFESKGKTNDHVWVHGRITDVIREGKSQRYGVLDLSSALEDPSHTYP